MPAKPNAVERLLLYRLNRGPAAMVDLLDAGAFHATALAIDLGLFEATADAGRPAAIAARIDADPEAIAPLLQFLTTAGYLTREGDAYRRTASTERWLTDDGRANLGPWFLFWRDVVLPFWRENAEAVVRTGSPERTLYEWLDDAPELWPTAQRGFRSAATLLADRVLEELRVPEGAERVVDAGGGHGYYAAALCERYPDLEAIVLDAPVALDVAREEAGRRGLEDRLRTRGGDYFTDDLGTGHDLILLFNVTHAHDDATVRALFEHVHEALAPGGRVAVLDQFAGSARTSMGRSSVAFVGLTYQITLGQTVHDVDAVAEWLRAAGFEAVERSSLGRSTPGNALLQARRD